MPRARPPRRPLPRRRTTPPTARSGRILFRCFLLLLGVALAAYAASPILLRFAVPGLLAAHGVPATVGAARLDLRNLELALSDLRLGEPGRLQIRFGEARVNLVREALMQGRIAIENVRLRHAALHAGALDEMRAPRGLAPDLPFEEVHLADLRLVALSEKLGREVVVRRARVHRGPGPGEGGLGYEIEVDAGGAPLTVRGTLHEDGEALRVEGRLSAGELPARLFDPAPPGEAGTWSGSMSAATDYALRYEPGSGQAQLRVSGSLRLAGVGARLRGLRIERATALWRGDLDLSGPLPGPPGRVRLRGTLDAGGRLAADPEGPLSLGVAGLHWEGEAGWTAWSPAGGAGAGGGLRWPAASDTFTADSLELVHAPDAEAPITVRLEGVRMKGRLDEAGRLDCERLHARRMRVRAAPGGAGVEVVMDDLQARGLRVSPRAARAARLLSSALEARTGSGKGALHWAAERLALDEVHFVTGDHARAATAAIDRVQARGAGADLDAFGARVQELRIGPREGLALGSASLERLEQRHEDRAVRVHDVQGESLAIAWNGAIEGGRVRAASLSGSRAGREVWSARALVAEPLRVRNGVFETDDALLGTLAWRSGNGASMEGAGLSARAFSLRPGGGGETERLHAGSLRYRGAAGGSWRARAAWLAGARWAAGGAGSAARAGTEQIRHRDAEGARWQLDALALGRPSISAGGEAGAESASAERATLVWPSGGTFEAQEIESGEAWRLQDGSAGFASLRVASLDHRSLSGLAWRATPVEADRLTRAADGAIEARRVGVRELSLDGAGGAKWQAEKLDASRFAWRAPGRLRADPLFVRRLRFARGGELAWNARTLLADAFVWDPGRFPRARGASAAVLEGARDGGPTWMLSDLQVAEAGEPTSGPTRYGRFSAGPGHLESAAGEARFSWFALHAEDLGIEDPERFTARLVAFEEAALRRGSGPGASLDTARVALHALTRDHRRFSAENVVLDETRASLGVGEEGEWMLPGWPGGDRESAGGWTLRIGEIGAGGHNRLSFFDRSVDPPYRAVIEPYRLAVSGLDTGDPRHGARLELAGAISEVARLEMSGELRAAPRGGLDLRAAARFRDFPLETLSGYASRHLGVFIEAGKGDLDLDFELAGGEIRSVGEAALHGLALHPAPQAGAGDRLAEAALARLADARGELRLRVPVNGPIADPGFDFGAAAARAIARSVGAAPESAAVDTRKPAAEGE